MKLSPAHAEACRFLALPLSERLALTLATVGDRQAAPWLDDEIMNSLYDQGIVERVRRKPEPGDCIASGGYVVQLTPRGRALVSVSPSS